MEDSHVSRFIFWFRITSQSRTEPRNKQVVEDPRSGYTELSKYLYFTIVWRLTLPPEPVLKHRNIRNMVSYLVCEDLSPAGAGGNLFPVHFDLRGRYSSCPYARWRLRGL